MLGSGRTEILQAIYGLTPLVKGEVLVEGKPVQIRSPRDAIENGINMVPEERRSQGLVLDFSVFDNLLMASFDRISHSLVIDKHQGQDIVDTAIRRLGVKPPVPRRRYVISLGQPAESGDWEVFIHSSQSAVA